MQVGKESNNLEKDDRESEGRQKILLYEKQQNAGITLIALVVTLVVLLILAGISITVLFGDSGIIKTAREAENKMNKVLEEEQDELNKLSSEVQNFLQEDNIIEDKEKDIFVFLYDDGTLAFGKSEQPIEGKTVVKEYGNIKGQVYEVLEHGAGGVVITTSVPWMEEISQITKVDFIEKVYPTTTGLWFSLCKNLVEIEHIENLETKNVIDMTYMFLQCEKLESIDLTNFDTSSLISTAAMFQGCKSLKSIDLTNFDTSRVRSMNSMFASCASLTSLDVSNFNTSNVASMKQMFLGLQLTEIKGLENLDTSNVVDMDWMFLECRNIKNLDLRNFNTSKVTLMRGMLAYCENLETLDLSSFDIRNVKDLEKMFYGSSKLTKIYVGPKWIISEEAQSTTGEMFKGCGTTSVTLKQN